MNDKNKVQILENKSNTVVVQGLTETAIETAGEMLEAIQYAFDQRTTHSTKSNDTSSCSHALCYITVKDKSRGTKGKFIVVDLAGSERAQDTQSNNRTRRLEGAEINKSLLALKECLRAMDGGNGHIPFRASKLTLALRDAFVGKYFVNRIIMFACVCPGSTSADHTINTLRYADRLKGKKGRNYDKSELEAIGIPNRKKLQVQKTKRNSF